MFGPRWKLFRLLGIEIRLDVSWIFLMAMIVWSLAAGVFRSQYPALSTTAHWWMAAAGALGLFASIVAHELSHALVARQYNLPINGITLFIFGGVAEMKSEPESAKAELLMAIAGPISSTLIGFFFHLVKVFGAGALPAEVIGVAGYLAWINLLLAAFNMIPAFPLDGGRVLRSIMWRLEDDFDHATQIAARIGAGFGILIMIGGVYAVFAGYQVAGVWYLLIGMFLHSASRVSGVRPEVNRRGVKADWSGLPRPMHR